MWVRASAQNVTPRGRILTAMTVLRVSYGSVHTIPVVWRNGSLDRSRKYICTRLLDHAVTRAQSSSHGASIQTKHGQQMSNKFGRMPHAGRQYIASHPYATPAPLRQQDPRVHGPPPASQTPLMAAPSAHDAADGTLHRWSECRASTNLLDVPCRSHSTQILGMYAAPPHGRTCTAELQAASMYLRERDDREGVSSEVVCSVRVGELRGGMQSCHELGQWTRTSIRPHYRTWYCSSCIIWSEAGGSASTLGVCQLHSTREPYCAGCLELSLMSPLPVESAHSTCHFGGCSASSPREIRSVGRDSMGRTLVNTRTSREFRWK